MTNTDQNSLVEIASTMAVRGAREYLLRNNLKAESTALSSCLKSWVKAKWPEAIADAKEAIDCGMVQIAQQTFAATMLQAGIEAAKEAGKTERAHDLDLFIQRKGISALVSTTEGQSLIQEAGKAAI